MNGGSKSVLLVEDDASIAELYAMKLRLDGFVVHLAADATTAAVVFDRMQPAVVCVDTRLPDRPGLATASDFARRGTPVILLTNDQESFETPPAGVSRSLLKSRTSPAKLSEAISELLAAANRR